jgi:hypothetical protein
MLKTKQLSLSRSEMVGSLFSGCNRFCNHQADNLVISERLVPRVRPIRTLAVRHETMENRRTAGMTIEIRKPELVALSRERLKKRPILEHRGCPHAGTGICDAASRESSFQPGQLNNTSSATGAELVAAMPGLALHRDQPGARPRTHACA